MLKVCYLLQLTKFLARSDGILGGSDEERNADVQLRSINDKVPLLQVCCLLQLTKFLARSDGIFGGSYKECSTVLAQGMLNVF